MPSTVENNSHSLLADEYPLTDAKSNEEISQNAAVFANVNRAASAIVPLITQEFEVRFKGSNESATILRKTELDKHCLHLAGTTRKVTVDWTCLREYLWLMEGGKPLILVNREDFKKVFTQKGKIKAMCEFWKDAAGHNKRNK